MTAKQVRVGDEFYIYMKRMQREIQARTNKKISEPEVTDLIASFYRGHKIVKLSKKRISYL